MLFVKDIPCLLMDVIRVSPVCALFLQILLFWHTFFKKLLHQTMVPMNENLDWTLFLISIIQFLIKVVSHNIFNSSLIMTLLLSLFWIWNCLRTSWKCMNPINPTIKPYLTKSFSLTVRYTCKMITYWPWVIGWQNINWITNSVYLNQNLT